MHATKFNAGNPSDSLETQSIKVLYKSCVLSPDELTVVRIKEHHLLFYKSGEGGGGLSPPTEESGGLKPPHPPASAAYEHKTMIRFYARQRS